MPVITPLPSPPSTSDPANFASKADAHILALQTFTTEVNAFGVELAGADVIATSRDTLTANATTTDLWNNSKVQDWTGTPTITALPNAPQAGSWRIAYPAAGTIITHGGNISVQGNASYTVASGDELTITAVTTTTFYVTIKRKDGTSVVSTVSYATAAEYKTGTNTTKVVNSAILRGNNLVAGTAVASTSGTSIDFTGIPSWAKRITVMFGGVSTNGTSSPQIQLGTSGGIEATGYVSAGVNLYNTGTVQGVNSTTGMVLTGANTAVDNSNGSVTLSLLGSNSWVVSGNIGTSATGAVWSCGGIKTLSATLDRIRITTVNGTNTFDAGSINIIYE